MSRPNARTSAVMAAIATGIAFVAAPARGDWPPSGLPLATGPTQQTFPVGLTGPGGELHAFWLDAGPSSAYALDTQHLTLQGTLVPGWPSGGRGVVAASAAISTPKLTPDGSGGAIFAWYDYRASGGPRGIYGIRVDAGAAIVPGWNSTGTPICTTTNAQGLGPLNNLVASSGALSASGNVAMAPNRSLNGRVNVSLGAATLGDTVGVPLVVGGTLDAPAVTLTRAAMVGAALGSLVMPGVGTGAGASMGDKVGERLKGLFGK